MPLTTSSASPMLPTPLQEEPMSDYDHHEGYDPQRRDAETEPPKKTSKPEPETKHEPAKKTEAKD